MHHLHGTIICSLLLLTLLAVLKWRESPTRVERLEFRLAFATLGQVGLMLVWPFVPAYSERPLLPLYFGMMAGLLLIKRLGVSLTLASLNLVAALVLSLHYETLERPGFGVWTPVYTLNWEWEKKHRYAEQILAGADHVQVRGGWILDNYPQLKAQDKKKPFWRREQTSVWHTPITGLYKWERVRYYVWTQGGELSDDNFYKLLEVRRR